MSSRKPSLVLVHGYRGAPIGLKTIAEELEEAGYEVYVPAIPPFGGATLGHTYDAKSYANYLAKYIKSKSLDHPVLIGHSMGSIIVAATAHFHPDLINQKIIFLSPIPERTGKVFQIISPLASFLPSRMVDYVTTRFLFVSPQKSTTRSVSLTNAPLPATRPRKISSPPPISPPTAQFPISHSKNPFVLSREHRIASSVPVALVHSPSVSKPNSTSSRTPDTYIITKPPPRPPA